MRLDDRTGEHQSHPHAIGLGAEERLEYPFPILRIHGDWRDKTESQIAAFSGEAARNFFPMAAFLNGCDFYAHAVQVAIIGQRDDPATEALIDAAYAVSLPHRVLQVVPPDAALPPSHPAHGKTQLNGSATAYVCVGMACGLPAVDAAGLTAQLRATRRV